MKSKESLKLAASSKIPRGYKHTELGVLPVDMENYGLHIRIRVKNEK